MSPNDIRAEMRGEPFVPKRIYVYSVEEGKLPAAFAPIPGMELFVVRANLAPALGPPDFQLPQDPAPR